MSRGILSQCGVYTDVSYISTRTTARCFIINFTLFAADMYLIVLWMSMCVSACVVTFPEQHEHILLWIFELLKLDMIVMAIIICDCDVVVVASLIISCSVGVAAGQTYCTEWLHCWRRHHAFLSGCVDVVIFTSSSSQSPFSGCRIEAAHFIFTMQ